MRDESTVHIPNEWLVPTVATGNETAEAAGRYRLCFEVASGGMATVYLALYQGPMGFEKVVALKTIHKHLAKEQQFLDMFFDEARIAAHIDHPFVCRVIDFGQAQKSYYIAMEYLLGEPLSLVYEAFAEKPALAASPDRSFLLARIIGDICEGLHAAHDLAVEGRSMNVVHRDVTPANLFVLYDGTVRVVDFGIATARDKLHQTELGTVKGKYAYVSPEQLELKRLDRRGDVWSLGVVFWEMLAGRRLFKRETHMETMRAVGAAEVRPPSSVREDIPKDLDSIVMQALERDRSERYPDARAMAMDIERFLSKHRRSVGRGELGSWLDELFPGAATKKRQLIELTRKNDTALPLDAGDEAAVTMRFRPEEPTNVRKVDEPTTIDAPAEDVEEAELMELPDGGARVTEVDPPTKDRDAAPTAAPAAVRPSIEPTEKLARPKNRGGEREKLAIRPSDRAPPRAGGQEGKTKTSPSWLAPAAILAIAGGAALAYYQPWANRTGPQIVDEVQPAAGASGTDAAPVSEEEDARAPNPSLAVSPDGIDRSSWPPFEEVVEDGPPGTLHVAARSGSAEIRRGDRVLGRTPLDVELPPGRHRLILFPDGGGPPRPLDVEIRSDLNTFMTVSVRD
jgi:serine/threonine-protein kinase